MKKISVIFGLCMILCFSQFGMADLIGYWKLDSGSGTTALSAINSPADDAPLQGAPVWETSNIPDIPGGNVAALIINDGDGINTPVPGIAGAGARTIAAWINVADGNFGGAIASWGDSWTSGQLGYRWTFKINNSSGELRAEIGGGYAYGTAVVTDGQWHHVAVTTAEGDDDMANVKFYIDGQLDPVSSFGNANPINSEAAPISIGYSKSAMDASQTYLMHLGGLVDDVRVYNTALAQNEIAALASKDYALPVSPVDGAELVALDSTLNWAAPENYVPTGYNVYFGTDPNLASADRVLTGTTAVTYNPFGTSDMAFETTYYWRVDAIDPASNVFQGTTWSFTTIPARPVVTAQPSDVLVAEGESFTLSVAALNPLTGDSSNLEYQWQIDGVDITAATSPDYSVSAASASDEGAYTCIVAISGNGSTTSEPATVGVKRMLARWTLDQADYANGQYLDSVNGYNADPNGTPTFTDGWDGTATGAITPNQDAWATAGTWNPAQFTGQYSASAWVKWDGSQLGQYGNGIVSKGSAYGADTMIFFLQLRPGSTADQANVRLYNYSSAATASNAVTANEWTHIIAAFDGSQLRIYVNGQRVAAVSASIDNGIDEPIFIGTSTGSYNPFLGQIDDVALYNYGLTDVEAAILYADYTGQSTCLYPPALDLTGPDGTPDCVVDLYDFAQFAANWMQCGLVPQCQ